MNELKIVVLCGGLSTERNISFLTGSRVCGALRARGHKAVLADLYMGVDDEEDQAGGFDPEALFENLPEIPQYSFDKHSVMYLFCSNSYITSHISKR